MHIVQFFPGVIPPPAYGGVERIVFWLTKELVSRGHNVTVLADGRSTIDQLISGVQLTPLEPGIEDYRLMLPRDADIVHFHDQPPRSKLPDVPMLVTEHGNRRRFDAYAPNTVFLSQSHAKNHNASLYVYNGIPKDYYPFKPTKKSYMLFMAKLNWKKKNAETAINLSFDTQFPLKLAGGDLRRARKVWGMWLLRAIFQPSLIDNVGYVADATKLRLLQDAKVLYYLVNWQEPFALACHEALASGTPVLATPNGALVEYIESGKNGFIVSSYKEARDALDEVLHMSASRLAQMAEYCRYSAFSVEDMATNYLTLYHRVIQDQYLYPPEHAASFYFTKPPTIVIKR